MIQRRNFLRAFGAVPLVAIPNPLMAHAALRADTSEKKPSSVSIQKPLPGEDVFAYIHRVHGSYDESHYLGILGAANEFKEGDQILGVSAANDVSRSRARELLGNTSLAAIDAHSPLRDALFHSIQSSLQSAPSGWASRSLAALKHELLTNDEGAIHAIKGRLSSDVIGCLVKLLSNRELIAIGAKVFNPLPGSNIGAKGYLGARIQPNSPTDHPDDIRWQVFSGFAYAVGDVLLGTNPVSSDPASVARVEKTLQEILAVFELQDVMPHCVLAHIDVQSAVEKEEPGVTELWFQSIAGNDTANQTFDISVEKMVRMAKSRTGRFGLYFETGQGADFTNGQAHGIDMVMLESRKYGFARALTQVVSVSKGLDRNTPSWVHVNDVAGFIGPEVFRTKEQLVRCCLEDIVMGKLHGLTIGLDVCSTLHMDVTLEDLDWCLSQIAPANPAYLMALPTKIDPMLGYLTTGFQDHVRLREEFGYRVNDRMWSFFKKIGVVDDQGAPTIHFGDPLWVYEKYLRFKGDMRTSEAIRSEGTKQLREIRDRGVFIARGYGDRPSSLAPELRQEIHRIYDDAKQCIWRTWDEAMIARVPQAKVIRTQSIDRVDYILHPASGEKLSETAWEEVERSRQTRLSHASGDVGRIQIVLSEGLNAAALNDEGNLLPFLGQLRTNLESQEHAVNEEILLIHGGRVRAGYQIGERLFRGQAGPRTILHVIGERPGSGHHTMSVYITCVNGEIWSQPGKVDHNLTRVVSGIATTAYSPMDAAIEVSRIVDRLMKETS